MNLFALLTPKAETFYLDAKSTIRQALEKFDAYKFSVVPLVAKDGQFVSTLSEGDLLRFIKNDCDFDVRAAENVLVSKIDKYRPYKAADLNAPFEDLVRLALQQNFVPVVDDRNMFIGIVKRKAVLNYLYERARQNEEN